MLAGRCQGRASLTDNIIRVIGRLDFSKSPGYLWLYCIPVARFPIPGKNCSNEHFCRREQRVISNNNDCVEELCQAPDCATCKSLKVWAAFESFLQKPLGYF